MRINCFCYAIICFISGFETTEMMYDSTYEVFDFVKQNFDIASAEPVYMWINNVFVDQDDILLGIMLALLKIYIKLKSKNPVM